MSSNCTPLVSIPALEPADWLGGRRVGVEIEFLGITPAGAAAALAHDIGGLVEFENANAYRLVGGPLGDITIEMDLRHLHANRHHDLRLRPGPRLAAMAGKLLSPIVPRELVTSPMPVRMLPLVDDAVASLRAAGGRGRGATVLQSLGLHFNIDPPSLDPATITVYLKSFLSLEAALADAAQGRIPHPTLARPPRFPVAYRDLVLDDAYWPDLDGLVRDYLDANPTRRRGLDLLPILAFLAPGVVRARLPREKIGARRAFHYRMPFAHVSDPDWSIVQEWSQWERVEAGARDLLQACRRA